MPSRRSHIAVTIPRDVYEVLERFYARHVEELRFKRGIKTISALVTDIIVSHLNQRDPDVLARAKVLEEEVKLA